MHISLIGGGITGLSTALALSKLGLHAHVYERSPEIRPVGAGIWLQPNALKVLDWLGVGQAIREAGRELDFVALADSQLKLFRQSDKPVTDEKGNRIVSIHRADLQAILAKALPAGQLHLGYGYKSHKGTTDRIRVEFGAQTVETDLLLGADGIHSQVRERVVEQASLRYSGQTCWRGIAEIVLPEALQQKGLEAWGKGIRLGFSEISGSRSYWFAVVQAPANSHVDGGDARSYLLKQFASFHPAIPQMIAASPQIIQHDLYDLQRLPTWHKGNVCLLGDAAHATTPNMGQGAGQGIEDAYYLSHLLAKETDPQRAFAKFEALRRPKVDHIVNTSWRVGKIAHHPLGRRIVPTLMRWTPQRSLDREMEKVFALPPVS